jgi:molecular chaperone GrpE
MDEAIDREEMQEDQRPPRDAGQDRGEQRSRFRRSEASSGKSNTPGDVDQFQGQPSMNPSLIAEALGELNLSNAQVEALETSVQELLASEQARTEEAVQRLARTQADFSNYKRRNDQEREQQARYATMLLVSELLPVLDNLDRALATVPESVTGLPWTDGLLLVDRQLRATLEKQGLQPINALGTRFDPTQHEAIIHEESTEHADDEVIAELRRGYILHDRVVRPTLVKVAKHVEATAQSSEEN